MTRKTCARRAASVACSQASTGSVSPNQTTAGRSTPPQGQRGGSGSMGTWSFRCSNPQAMHRTRQMSPCSLMMLPLPARSCNPSTFCVTRVNLSFARRSSSTRARCPGFGCALWMIWRRQSYHSQTSLGSFAKAFGDASFSGEKFLHSPEGPRKVGIPLSAEIPAPVKATIRPVRRLRRTASVAPSTLLPKSRQEILPKIGYYALP